MLEFSLFSKYYYLSNFSLPIVYYGSINQKYFLKFPLIFFYWAIKDDILCNQKAYPLDVKSCEMKFCLNLTLFI